MSALRQRAIEETAPAPTVDYEAKLAELGRRRKTVMSRLRYLGDAIEQVIEGAAERAGIPDREFSDDASAVLHLKGAALAAAEKK